MSYHLSEQTLGEQTLVNYKKNRFSRFSLLLSSRFSEKKSSRNLPRAFQKVRAFRVLPGEMALTPSR